MDAGALGDGRIDEAVAISKTWLVEAELVLKKCAARDEDMKIKIEYEKNIDRQTGLGGMSTLYE